MRSRRCLVALLWSCVIISLELACIGGSTSVFAATGISCLSSNFDTDNSGFTYQDDVFRSTANPVYASGNFDASGGHSGGGLHVAIGGVDGNAVTNGMSGGWSHTFTVDEDDTVTVTIWYRLVFHGNYEPDECGQALASIDGQLLESGTQDYLHQYCGFGDGNPTQDTGWLQATFQVFLTSGTHSIAIGGWNNKKTAVVEMMDVYFDEIEIARPSQNPVADALVVTEEGNVGIGTASPNGKLDVDGSIMAGNSDIYFTKTDHQCTGIGNTSGYAAIENAENFDALMILGRAGTPKGRSVRLWDYLQVNGGMDVTGNVGIGKSDPSAKLDVDGKIVMRNQTQNTDSADTVATKGYTDSKIAAAATFPASLTQNGYQKLPSGLIIQWGKVTGAFSGPRAINFPTSFPNAALSISVSYDPGGGDTVLFTRNFNNSGVTFVATKYPGAYGSFNNPTIHYIAIGF